MSDAPPYIPTDQDLLNWFNDWFSGLTDAERLAEVDATDPYGGPFEAWKGRFWSERDVPEDEQRTREGAARSQCSRWTHGPGTRVRYWPGERSGPGKIGETSGPASTMPDA